MAGVLMAAPFPRTERAAEGLAVTNKEELPEAAGRSPRQGEMVKRDGFTWPLALAGYRDLYDHLYTHQPPGRRRAVMQELMLRGLQAQTGGALSPPPVVTSQASVMPPKARPTPAVRPPSDLPPTSPAPAGGKVKLGAVRGFKA